jgi:hypothetical protein
VTTVLAPLAAVVTSFVTVLVLPGTFTTTTSTLGFPAFAEIVEGRLGPTPVALLVEVVDPEAVGEADGVLVGVMPSDPPAPWPAPGDAAICGFRWAGVSEDVTAGER